MSSFIESNEDMWTFNVNERSVVYCRSWRKIVVVAAVGLLF